MAEEVIGDTDWRSENLRFDGEHVCAVYDWESLVLTSEPTLVGERRTVLGAAYAYATAYTARCGHAIDPEGAREGSEGFRTLVNNHRLGLMNIFRPVSPPLG
jgi:hypothetical protein